MKALKTFRTRGFALIVTLSLMILLTIVAVGLLTLSAVSLRSSSQGDAMAAARANARMALMLAVGEIQRELGPDSRISAPHDAGSVATGGSPRWTAVYDAWQRPTEPNQAETPESRQPTFRGWLASGANASRGGPQGLSDRAWLVGDGTLGKGSQEVDQVRVPMHQIVAGSTRGRFGWWISDEGTKAKVNAGPSDNSMNPDVRLRSSFGNADPFYNSQSPPNIEHRAFPQLSSLEWKSGKREKSISNRQLTLAAGLKTNDLGNSIHDLTVYSQGVIADVRSGRLKRDLGNLLSRPLAQLRDRPLYLANGRMNTFDITRNGDIRPTSIVSPWESAYNSPNQWGINLEELHLFHNLHRELSWVGGQPRLETKASREAVVSDPFYLYRRPAISALQFILSLRAVPDSNGKFRMEVCIDGMVAISNPNDVPLRYSPGLVLPFQLLEFPYVLNLKVRSGGSPERIVSSRAPTLEVFKGYVEGGAAGIPSTGFTLEPGEAAVFGSSTANQFTLNLSRGFDPSGGVTLQNWDTKATGLNASDIVDVEFTRITSARGTADTWMYYNVWNGDRTSKPARGWQMDQASISGGNTLGGPIIDQTIPPIIRTSGPLSVEEFSKNKPKPVLLLSFLQNVEQQSTINPPDAFASRPIQLSEPALFERSLDQSRIATDRHSTQMLITAEPMNYRFFTMAGGAGGRNVYHGGGRVPNLGGSFNVIHRRIPVAPPLSIGAFQNAIASGFSDRFAEMGKRTGIGAGPLRVDRDDYPASAVALSGNIHALPLVSKAIGNSNGIPHLQPNEVFRAQSAITKGVRRVPGNVATDQSWMVNTALWDSWFLSSIVDGMGNGSSSWQSDNRSQRSQFTELAEGDKTLRNKRYLFHPHKPVDEATKELFQGQNLNQSAINTVAKYLMIDGAFNVNSTSVPAWTAFLSSVREQSLRTSSGSSNFTHPFGTLGYAQNTATKGVEGDWSGLRDLSVGEMDRLATAIVAEVRSRGPFLSLADFVNRRPNSTQPAHQAVGALQAAINLAGLNDQQASGNRAVQAGDFNGLAGASGIASEPAPARAVGNAGYLSQGSLLTAIGSQIAVRSDTFTIRAYGDARNSANQIVAKAWCEAVIQRTPEYLDPSDAPEDYQGAPIQSESLSEVNVTFGRRMEIKSVRWLTESEV